MIVEDEHVCRRALGYLLESYGYRTVLAESGEQALDILSGQEWPDAVLLDVDLPGISGLELLTKLRQMAPQVVPIIVTAAESHRVASATDRGVEYVRKPIDFRHLLNVLGHSLEQH